MTRYGYTVYARCRQGEDFTYEVRLWRQPMRRWVIAVVYHWYDMWIFRVPGFKTVERWLRQRKPGGPFSLPLSARQDCRCYDLNQRGRIELARYDITEDTYNKLRHGSAPS